MSGVLRFDPDGVFHLAEGSSHGGSSSRKRQVLVYLPTGQVVSSYSSLEQMLTGLGWERYYRGDPNFFQFHKHSSIDLISLPREFSKFGSIQMFDIVLKNSDTFRVRDMWVRTSVCLSVSQHIMHVFLSCTRVVVGCCLWFLAPVSLFSILINLVESWCLVCAWYVANFVINTFASSLIWLWLCNML
jgi:hypothetical protein